MLRLHNRNEGIFPSCSPTIDARIPLRCGLSIDFAAMKKTDYVERILAARVYDVANESPLEPAPALSRRTGNRILLKREDEQPVFSFKLRGAYNKMASLPAAALRRGVIAASAG